MFILLGIVVIVISLLLTLIVLIQNPKGGVMSSAFGTMGNQILGANRSTDVIEKITWYLAAGLIGLSIVSLFILPSPGDNAKDATTQQKSEIEEALKNGKGNSSLPTATMPSSSMPAQSAPQTQPEGNSQASPAAPDAKK